ncbi:MAG: 2,3,4,5-tetrahydropyridine-2,6-dicarboxylate N-succinyltransferase, partial [Flavobacteriaceae bacterium]
CLDGILQGGMPYKPGSYTKAFAAGEYQVPCALIIGKRKESTNKKTSLNDALREHNVAV